MGRGEFLARFPPGNDWTRLTEKERDLLQRWDRYLTADGAAERFRLGASEIEDLVESGRLWRESGFAIDCARSEVDPPASISTIGILATGDLEAAKRAVLSFGRNAKDYGHEPELFVIDDSRAQGVTTLSNRQQQTISPEIGLPMRVRSQTEREAFAAELSRRSGVPLAVARFAALGDEEQPERVGAALNCLALESAGSAFLAVHEECVCDSGVVPDRADGLVITSKPNPWGFWRFQGPAGELSREGRTADLLGAHQELLGRDIGAWAEKNGSLDLASLSAQAEARLRARGGRISVTSASVLGDYGFDPLNLLTLDSDSAARLAASEEVWRSVVAHPSLVRAVTRKTIGPPTVCLSPMAVDVSVPQPPFAPTGRDPSAAFAAALSQAYPDHYAAYLPESVSRDNGRSSEQAGEGRSKLFRGPCFSEIVARWLTNAPHISGSVVPPDRLVRLGDWLSEAAALPQHEYDACLRRYALEEHISRLTAPQEASDESGPEFFAGLRRRLLEEAEAALETDECITPIDLAGVDPQVRRAKGRELTSKLGALFQAWPALIEAAAELRRSGAGVLRQASKAAHA